MMRKKLWKFIKRTLLGMVIFIALLFLLLSLVKTDPMQELVESDIIPQLEFDSTKMAAKFDSLNALYGRNKSLLPTYELHTLLALSFFPELKDTRIDFLYEPALIPMASRPAFASMFKSKDKWKYDVIISSKSIESMEPILMHHLPFNGQVGILVHELGHTFHYRNFNMLQMMKFGLQYLVNKNYRATHERSTDALAVYRGAGAMLFEYAHYIRHETSNPEAIEASMGYMDKYYMSDQEIVDMMTELKIYDGLDLKKK